MSTGRSQRNARERGAVFFSFCLTSLSGAPLDVSFAVPDSETILSGPSVVAHVETSDVVRCRILRPAPTLAELPDEITSASRPKKKTTVLLWSRRRFLKRLHEIKVRAGK